MLNNWVLRSTELSVNEKQWSFCALVETIVVCAVYWTFALKWLLLAGAIVAPFLLMRSTSSKELGTTLLREYWQPSDRDWEKFDRAKKIFLISLTLLAASSITALTIDGLPYTWELVYRSLIAGFVGIVGAGVAFLAIDCKLSFQNSTFKTFVEIFMGGVGAAALGAFLTAGIYAGICSGFCALLTAAIAFGARSGNGPKGLAGTQEVTLSIVFFAIPYMLAVFLRTVAIRVFATLRHLPEGIKALPDNWADNCWRMDVFYPASILPEAYSVSRHLTVKGLQMALKESRNWREKVIYAFSILLYWLSANFYRLALKSTLWAWWPLVFFLKPVFDGMSDDERQNRTRMTLSWATKPTLGLGVFWLLVYLGYILPIPLVRNLILNLSENVYLSFEKVNRVIDVPSFGLIWWGLLISGAVTVVLFSYANQINILFRTELDSGRLQLLSPENQNAFLRLASLQEFWRRTLMFALIQSFWWMSLYVLNLEIMHVRIPEWIW